MKRFALLLAALGMLIITVDSNAAPRRWGGGYGYGGGYYGNGYGYGNNYSGIGVGNYGTGIGVYSGTSPYYNGYGGYSPYYGSTYSPYYGGYSSGYTPYYNSGYAPSYSSGYTPSYNNGYGSSSYIVPANWYSAAPWTSRSTPSGTNQEITPASYSETAPMTHWGLRIDEVSSGSAAEKAQMQKGDIIVGIGKTRTETFEELQQALAASKGTIELTFVNAQTQRMEKTRLTPVNGKLGVSVVPISMH